MHLNLAIDRFESASACVWFRPLYVILIFANLELWRIQL